MWRMIPCLDDADESKVYALCRQPRTLCQSHITPKFVSKWLKRTSMSGGLAHAARSDKRVQDTHTISLLCNDCEERFSKYENYFSYKIFKPYHNKSQSFEYDCNLELFATSLSWRILKTRCNEVKSSRPDLGILIDEAEYCWREFLLGKRSLMSPYESHLLFLGGSGITNSNLIGSDWYKFRTVGGTLVTTKNGVFVYSLFPHMLIITSIYPTNRKGWSGTLIEKDGKMTTLQSTCDVEFKDFFRDHARLTMTLSTGPSVEQSRQRLNKALARDPRQVLRSESAEIMLRDIDATRRKKMKGMPESVRALVEEVILKAVDDPDASDEHNQRFRWNSRHIANLLANLPRNEFQALDHMITSVIHMCRTTQKPTRGIFKMDSVWVVFMARYNTTKDHQRSEILASLQNLQHQPRGTKMSIVVFSMNCESDNYSFESGFAFPKNSRGPGSCGLGAKSG